MASNIAKLAGAAEAELTGENRCESTGFQRDRQLRNLSIFLTVAANSNDKVSHDGNAGRR